MPSRTLAVSESQKICGFLSCPSCQFKRKASSRPVSTILDIAAELGADIALVTEQSRKAISEQDISFYRDEIAARETDLETLRSEIALLRSERVEEVRFYRDQIALLRDQINRKDGYIDLVVEVARKGGDLKALENAKGVE